jgi:uncharacterized protein (TIGR00255 family)
MIKSMTGFASLTREDALATLSVTVKTVNHRFLDVQFRMPSSLAHLESRAKAALQRHVSRGRVELVVSVQTRTTTTPTVELNADFARALAATMDRAREEGLVAGMLTPGDLLRLPQAITVKDRTPEPGAGVEAALEAVVEAAIAEAGAQLDQMRTREGDHLRADLEARRVALGVLVGRIEEAAEDGRQGLETRLRERVDQIRLESPADPVLVAQEVVRAASRSDISEEVTRFRGHLAHWLALADAEEPCGRKLDFLLQEMNREINTIGSKADGLRVSELVITAKAELEKMREQVQNVE